MEVQVVDALPRLLPDVGYHPVAFQSIDGAILTPKVMRSYNFVSTLARRFKRL